MKVLTVVSLLLGWGTEAVATSRAYLIPRLEGTETNLTPDSYDGLFSGSYTSTGGRQTEYSLRCAQGNEWGLFSGTNEYSSNRNVAVTVTVTAKQIITVGGVEYEFVSWENSSSSASLEFKKNNYSTYYAYYRQKTTPCATISASKTNDVVWGETIDFRATDMNEDLGLNVDFQWQYSSNGSSWSNISGETDEEMSYTLPANANRYYRLQITPRGGTACYSNTVTLSLKTSSLSYEVIGATKLNDYTYEVESGSDYSIVVYTTNATVTSSTVKQTELEKTNTQNITPASTPSEQTYKVSKVSESYSYSLSYSTSAGSLSAEFIVRVVHTCHSSYSETIWKDDFGYFTLNGSNSTYTYVDADLKTQTITADYKQVSGWKNIYMAKDMTGSFPASNGYVYAFPYIENGGNGCDDERYCLVKNAREAKKDNYFFDGTDHTGNANGAMMVVNFASYSQGKVAYEREFNIDCDGAIVYLSVYMRDANGSLTSSDDCANVLMEVAEKNGSTVASTYSGDMRPQSYDGKDYGTNWHNLTAKFTAKKDVTYVMRLKNNHNSSRSGNDVVFDDISITVCYPDVSLSDDPIIVNESHHMAICGKEKSNAEVYVACSGDITQYFENPVFLYQYQNAAGVWNNLNESDPYSSESGFSVDLTEDRLADNQGFRVIVAATREKIANIVDYYSKNGEFPPVACDNYYGVSNENFTISYYPELSEINSEQSVSCPGDEVTVGTTLTGYNYKRWYDKDWKEVAAASGSDTYTFQMGRTAQTYYLVVAAEEGICKDTATYKVSINRKVTLACEDVTLSADNKTDHTATYTLVHPTASSCVSDNFAYSYKTDENAAYGAWSEGNTVVVKNGDVIYWKVIMDGDEELYAECQQTVEVLAIDCQDEGILSEDGSVLFPQPAAVNGCTVDNITIDTEKLTNNEGVFSGTLPFGETSVTYTATRKDKTYTCNAKVVVIKETDSCSK